MAQTTRDTSFGLILALPLVIWLLFHRYDLKLKEYNCISQEKTEET